ncbi:TIGR01621 family pseudouridine synthase [Neptunomonas phycophila]|uniref:TIGR01621 family pseudouridine synthase n=1 Tax=Neptunomonas phycophila TaxID=1572645 RepID=UPI0037351333
MSAFRIIANHADFIIINKAPGISVHKDDNESGLTMELSAALGIHVYLVHRLDKVTSGVMVFAKSADAAAEIADQFAKKTVKKFYIALSDKKPSKKQGLVKGDMIKARRGAWKLTKTNTSPAQTHFFSMSPSPGRRLFLLKPSTGKTHQLRVALKSVGAPVLGDALYSGSPADRTYLHAWQLMFSFNENHYHFIAQPEWGRFFDCPEVEAQLKRWEQPASLKWPANNE